MSYFNRLRTLPSPAPPQDAVVVDPLYPDPYREDSYHFLSFRLPHLQKVLGVEYKDNNWALLAGCGPSFLKDRLLVMPSYLPFSTPFFHHWAPRLESVYRAGRHALQLILLSRHQTDACRPSSIDTAEYVIIFPLFLAFLITFFAVFILVPLRP